MDSRPVEAFALRRSAEAFALHAPGCHGCGASATPGCALYYANFGVTGSRFYAMTLLIWIGAMLLWLAATVLRGRRDRFAFGALVSGLATVALLFVVNPDAVVARTNVSRITPVQFDAAYAHR